MHRIALNPYFGISFDITESVFLLVRLEVLFLLYLAVINQMLIIHSDYVMQKFGKI